MTGKITRDTMTILLLAKTVIWCVRNAIKRSHLMTKLSHFNYNLCLQLTLVHIIAEAIHSAILMTIKLFHCMKNNTDETSKEF